MARADRGWDIYAATMSAVDADGFIGIQVDVEGSQSPDGTTPPAGGALPYEMIAPGGLYHRPLDPVIDKNGNVDPAQTAQIMVHREGGRCFASVLTDPRVIPNLPQIEPGGSVLYAGNASLIRIVGSGKNAGRVSTFTTVDGTRNGQAVVALVWPDRHQWYAPWGKMTFDKGGFDVRTQWGARLTLGGIGGLPLVASAVGSTFAAISAASIELDAPSVALGNGLAKQPVVLSVTLQALLTAITSVIADLQTALTATVAAVSATPAANGAPLAPELAALLTTLSADVGVLSTAVAALPTISSVSTTSS
jgi:hypothetical protein